MNKSNLANIRKQQGAATLLISVSILAMITFVTVYTSKSVLMEQTISNNDARTKQAFEAAEAGISAAIIYLSDGPDRDNDGVIDDIFDSDGDGVTDTNETMVGNNRVVVAITDLGDMRTIQIDSTGFSDDSTATRQITRIISARVAHQRQCRCLQNGRR